MSAESVVNFSPLVFKKCSLCGENKSLVEFPFVTSKRTARRTSCKQCAKNRKDNAEYRRSQSQRNRFERRNKPENRAKEIQQGKNYRTTPMGRARTLWHGAKHRAKTNSLEFNITVEFIHVVLIVGVCQKTGIPFDLSQTKLKTKFNPYAPSIDRKNPFGGYTFDNVQIVCNSYNLAKNQMTDEQFISFCQIVLVHNVK